MAQAVQQPYNMFKTPQLTRPVQVYDPTRSVVDNMAGNGVPSAQNIASAYNTPQTQQQPQPRLDSRSSSAGMDYLNSLYTTPEQEEKLRRASQTNQRILAIGDAVRHIGNIVNTVGYAPSQQFNDPVALEQARYDKYKALRDKANLTYLTYQQQKAAQDVKARQLESEIAYRDASLGIRKAEHQRLIDAQKLAERKQDFLEDLKKQQIAIDKAYKEHKMSYEDYVAETGRINARANWIRAEKYQPGGHGGVGDYETTTDTEIHYDENGNRTGSTTTRRRTGGSRNLNLEGDGMNLGLN